jgi:hypothetical protein
MNELATALTRVSILVFALLTAWLFHDPRYLLFIVMWVFTRQGKKVKKQTQDQLEDLQWKLDALIGLKEQEMNQPKPKEKLDK